MEFIVLLNPWGTHTLDWEDVSKLPSVTLNASEDDDLIELAHRAEAQAGIHVRHGRLLFPSIPRKNGSRQLTGVPSEVVKEDGTIFWLGYPPKFTHVNIADLERSQNAGFFNADADPHCVLWDHPTTGNGAITQTWPDLFQWLIDYGALYAGGKASDSVLSMRTRLIYFGGPSLVK